MADKYFTYNEDEYDKVYRIMYCKTDEEINNSLQCLKNWLGKQAHLPQNEDEFVLRKMLMLNKFSVEKTKEKLEIFYSGKTFLPEYFENFSPKDKKIQKILKLSVYLPLPRLIHTSNQRVIIVKLSHKNLDEFDAVDFLRMNLMSVELRLLSNDISIGDVVLIDMAESTIPVLAKFSPTLLRNSFNYITGSYTDRIRSMNFINVPSFAYTIISLIKSLLKNKLAERIEVHKDLDSLYNKIPKTALPEEYGGDLKSIEEIQNDWFKYMMSQDTALIQRSKMKSNEKLRIGEPVKSELFGLEGSFQKLAID